MSDPYDRMSASGRLLPVASAAPHTGRASRAPLVIVAWSDAKDGQRAGDDGQRRRRPWSVSLATLVSYFGEAGQVAGVLQ